MGVTLSSPTRSDRSWAQLLVQLLRFCLVGGLNTFIDLMIFNILLWTFPTQFVHRLIFYNSVAYLLGAINSFCWNKLWTFKQRRQTSKGEVARFAAVTILGILCNDTLLWFATCASVSLHRTRRPWLPFRHHQIRIFSSHLAACPSYCLPITKRP